MLLVVSVVGVLIFGSILVASRLTGLDVSDAVGGDGDNNQGAVGSPTGESTPTAGQASGTQISETPVVAAPDPHATIVASPTAVVNVGEVTAPKDVAEAYAKVWSAGNYNQLYDLLSRDSQAFISREDFVARYEAIAVEVGIKTLSAEITGGDEDDELFPMKVEIDSARVGTIEDENLLPVIMDGDKPSIDWTPSLIFSQLGDGYVQWTSDVPQRGRILDRKGKPLAQMGQITRVGVVPGKITNEADLLQRLSELLDMPQDIIKNRFAGGQADWFMPVKDLPGDVDQSVVDQLTAIEGVAIQRPPARVYPQGN